MSEIPLYGSGFRRALLLFEVLYGGGNPISVRTTLSSRRMTFCRILGQDPRVLFEVLRGDGDPTSVGTSLSSLRMLHENNFNLKLSGNEVYYTA